jgi:CheY-like chemotaxis protein
MDADTLARVFEPFYTTKEVGRGTGMGLAVVHGLVHQAGGHIVVDSQPGRGTEFRILFPAAVENSAYSLGHQPATPADRVTLAGRHVLIVDDEAPMRRLLMDLFEGEDMRVTPARDGHEALALVRSHPQDFDLMFTDQTMPEMTGIELVEALRAVGASMPVVLMSGYGDEATRRAVTRCGALFLAKPALPSEVLETCVNAHSGRSRGVLSSPCPGCCRVMGSLMIPATRGTPRTRISPCPSCVMRACAR